MGWNKPLTSIALLIIIALMSQLAGAFLHFEKAIQRSPSVLSRQTLNKRLYAKDHIVGQAKGIGQAHYEIGTQALSGLPPQIKDGELFTVLGIETSCDDTGVAIVRSDGLILGEALASQHQIHEEFGGIRPGLARDAHVENLDTLVKVALHDANVSLSQVDAFAATVGPGLELCLRVGASMGRELALKHSKPFVAVHHLEAHCLLARPQLENKTAQVHPPLSYDYNAEFPFLSLLVSGGHCQILLVHGVGRYTVLGSTLDDAVGEAFDKAARMIGLATSTNGGPAIEKLAKVGSPLSVTLPKPMNNVKNRQSCNFSFSGLKNAFRLAVQKKMFEHGLLTLDDDEVVGTTDGNEESQLHKQQAKNSKKKTLARLVNVEEGGTHLPHQVKADLAASFQHVAVTHLIDKVSQALDICDQMASDHHCLTHQVTSNPNQLDIEELNRIKELNGFEFLESPRTIAVVGGVAANAVLRSKLIDLCQQRNKPLKLVAPPPRLCTDNGVMIAWAAIEKLKLGVSDLIELPPGTGKDSRPIDVFPRWPLGPELFPWLVASCSLECQERNTVDYFRFRSWLLASTYNPNYILTTTS